eukprot:6157386-Prymnesium_polylepis.1
MDGRLVGQGQTPGLSRLQVVPAHGRAAGRARPDAANDAALALPVFRYEKAGALEAQQVERVDVFKH